MSATTSPWGDSHFQREYAWPGVRERLPAVDDAAVLLAGCGRGDHVGYFRERDATVTGVDASPDALSTARERHPGCEFAACDLGTGLPFDDGAFDVVLSNLVLSHLPDLDRALAAVERVLADDGAFVAGVIHPAYQRSHWDLEAYAEPTARVVDWGAATLRSHYRPTSAIVQAFVDAGLKLERVAEPTPLASYADANPERYAAAMAEPQVLVVRARKQ
nr:class I SAM-dependent methyltransferase [Halorubellus sp. JP-L1]